MDKELCIGNPHPHKGRSCQCCAGNTKFSKAEGQHESPRTRREKVQITAVLRKPCSPLDPEPGGWNSLLVDPQFLCLLYFYIFTVTLTLVRRLIKLFWLCGVKEETLKVRQEANGVGYAKLSCKVETKF